MRSVRQGSGYFPVVEQATRARGRHLLKREFPVRDGMATGRAVGDRALRIALGDWMSGKVFDLTGSYHAAFFNGIGWNLMNIAIIGMLLFRLRSARLPASRVAHTEG